MAACTSSSGVSQESSNITGNSTDATDSGEPVDSEASTEATAPDGGPAGTTAIVAPDPDGLPGLADLDPAIAEVLGHTRYRIEGVDEGSEGEATAVVVDRGGISQGIPSRTDRSPTLRGTKHQVALERRVFVALGRSDGRSLVFVPELKDNVTTGMTLLQVRFADELSPGAARGVLQGYRNRYSALRDAVLETEDSFREDILGEQSVTDLLTLPINALADRWRVGGNG